MWLKMILYISFFLFTIFFPLDKVSVVVGDKIILESSIAEQVDAFMGSSKKSYNRQEIRGRVIDYLIEQEVLIYFAKKDTSLSFSNEQVNNIVNERLSFFKEQLGSVGALEEYFGVPYLEIKNILTSEAENIILADSFKQNLFSMVSVSNSEVEDFYMSYKDSLPLTPFLYSYSCFEKKVLPQDSAREEAYSLANSVLKKIERKESSFEDFYSIHQGGDLGLFKRGTFIPEFEKVAFSLKEGTLSPPVLSSLGYHLIRLNKRVGEKIDASHILFPIHIKKSDNERVVNDLKKLAEANYNFINMDSIALKNKILYGGVYKKAPEDQIPPAILKSLKSMSLESFSDVFLSSENLYSVVFLKEVHPPEKPDLYEYWGFVENLALEKKFSNFYENWYDKNKRKVYIKIF